MVSTGVKALFGWCVWAGRNKIIVDRLYKMSDVFVTARGVVVDSLFGLGLPLGSRYYVIHLRSKCQIGLCLLARGLFEFACLRLTPSCSRVSGRCPCQSWPKSS